MLDATVGSASANSYATVAEAEAYFSTRVHSASWESSVNKPELLITASKQLDWYIRWKGDKATYTQSMDWPRIDILYPDGTEYPSTVIPSEVKVAVFEMALSSIDSDRSADQDLDGLAELRAGSLMLKTDSTLRATKFSPIPDKVKKILKAFMASSGIGVVRLMRG